MPRPSAAGAWVGGTGGDGVGALAAGGPRMHVRRSLAADGRRQQRGGLDDSRVRHPTYPAHRPGQNQI